MKIINIETKEILIIDERLILGRSKIASKLKKDMESIEKKWEKLSDNLDTSVNGYLVSTRKNKQSIADRCFAQYLDAEKKYLAKLDAIIKKRFVGFKLQSI